MAGMLPGVECARRRRFHLNGGWSESPNTSAHGSTRRSSFCLYTSNHEAHLSSSSNSLQQRNSVKQQAYHMDEKLGCVAREAKERLDERLRAQRKSSETRRNQESLRGIEERTLIQRDLQTEVYGSKKSTGSRRFITWSKLRWKASDQDECAICLEQFRAGETLVNLPCAHRFHSRCLVPWLDTNAHCPCCRMGILI